MNRIKLSTMTAMACLAFMANAQTLFFSSNQKLIEAAVAKGFYLLEQTYQLEDPETHRHFGRFGNDVFGGKKALALRTENGTIVNADVLKPWQTDPNFERYSETHTPCLAYCNVYEFGDSTAVKAEFEVIENNTVPNPLVLMSNPDDTTGFVVERFTAPTDGWCVWVTGESTVDEADPVKMPRLSIITKTIEFSPTESTYSIDAPQVTNNIWGGIFIVPDQTEIGQLTFKLGGIMTRDDEAGTWSLKTVQPVVDTAPVVPQEELTPLSLNF